MSGPEDRTKKPSCTGEERPACFGDEAEVCPKDQDGIRQPQVECLSCKMLKACLREALQREGVISRRSPEVPAVSRLSQFFKRWSDQKLEKALAPDKGAGVR